MLFLDVQLLSHELFLDFSLVIFQCEAACLLLKLCSLDLRRLLEPHELLIVFVAKHQLLLLDLLVQPDVVLLFLLISTLVQLLRVTLV